MAWLVDKYTILLAVVDLTWHQLICYGMQQLIFLSSSVQNTGTISFPWLQPWPTLLSKLNLCKTPVDSLSTKRFMFFIHMEFISCFSSIPVFLEAFSDCTWISSTWIVVHKLHWSRLVYLWSTNMTEATKLITERLLGAIFAMQIFIQLRCPQNWWKIFRYMPD